MAETARTTEPNEEPTLDDSAPEERQPRYCKSCNKAAVRHSHYCEDHQEQVVPKLTRKHRIRRLDVMLLLLLAGLVVGYPKIKAQLLRAVGHTDANDDNSTGLLDDIKGFFGWSKSEQSQHGQTSKQLAASIRDALTGGGEAMPASVEQMLQRAEAGGPSASLDDMIDQLSAASGRQQNGLSGAQVARLQSLKSKRGGGATAAHAQVAQAAPAPARVVLAGPIASLARCGNGEIDPGEQCDGTALGGATCAGLGFSGDCDQADACVRSGLGCLANCTFDYSGCTAESQAAAQRFVDHGNGTATDRLTGLTWELKCADPQCADRHSVLGVVSWQSAASDWTTALNNEQFAGHNDWRLPTIEELRTLLAAVPPCAVEPCAVAAWPRNQTAPAGYWSSTSFSVDKHRAWAVSFRDGDVYTAEKGEQLHVRAVRLGS